MKLFTLALFLLASFLHAAEPSTKTWTIDPAHSTIGFKVKHMMVTTVHGSFSSFKGTIVADEKDLSKSTVDVSIDIKSVYTGVPKRDEHLLGADFFDEAKFPHMTFVSRKVKQAGKGKLELSGDLTIRGVTKAVVLKVDGPTPTIKDPYGNSRKGVSATTRISRKEFGLTYNAVLEAGGVAISDEVDIILDLQFLEAK